MPISDRIVWRDVFADPMELRRRVDEAEARAQAAVCAACHDQNGISANPLWPSLAGQHEA